ncbi:putative ribonuclease H-like domain-containing protein [Tanacetum coccineum]
MTKKLGDGFKFNKKACFVCVSLNHLIKDCNFYENKMVGKSVLNNIGRVTGQREIRPVWNNAQRVNHQNKFTHPHPKRNFVPRVVVTKSGQVPVNTAKQSSPRAAASISTARRINTVAPKSKVNDALSKTYSYFKAHSLVNNVTTAGPEVVVSTAEGKRENVVKSSACWIWRPTGKVIDHISKDSGSYIPKRFNYVDPHGRLKYMTGNKSFLTDYQEVDGGFVAFAGSPKGGKIARKGKIRTGKLDFEDVYFVKEFKFNLFSVSQMCDKKNSVLFTETECLVLYPDFKQDLSDFKLLDESQVLLKVPRQNNMYSFDLKNIFPLGGLTCLNANATIDECNLWHRRLSHINFKTMNKLVRGNLVRATKDETSGILKTFITGIENQINLKVKIIRCDNGTKFKNNDMNQFCGMKGIKMEFSVARTPQQNGVAERKNRTLIEAARTMLVDSLSPTTFWTKAVNTACYVQTRVLVTKPHNKTPYELLLGRPPSISFMRPFGCPMTIINTLDPLGKFDEKADEGFLVGYCINSKAFRVFNTRTRKVEENLHINFLENKPNVAGSIKDNVNDVPTQQYILLPLLYDSLQSSKDAVANDAGKKTNEDPAHKGERNAQEKEGGASNKENDQNVQDFRAELDNLLFQQKEGYANSTNRDSTVSPSVSTTEQNFTNADDLPTDPLIPDLEDTGIFSGAYEDEYVGAEADLNNLETTMNMDVKSAFLYGTIKEDVYVCQPPGFEDPQFPNKVYKVEKALYGLHQAPRAWYETLSTYLLENGYRRGTIDKTLFIKNDRGNILLVQVYVDDIIFGSTKKSLYVEFEKIMHKRFQMSSMGELTYFLGLQAASTPIETNKALNKDEEAENVDVHLYRLMIGSLMYLTASRPDIMFVVCACARDSPFDLEAFSDSDYAVASLDRKSTTGGCQFLGKRLISWQCKKQTIFANSTTKAEYVVVANCYGQVLWIQN